MCLEVGVFKEMAEAVRSGRSFPPGATLSQLSLQGLHQYRNEARSPLAKVENTEHTANRRSKVIFLASVENVH